MCSFAFQNAVGAFPPGVADIRPAVVFRNRLFSGEELAHAVVSVPGDVPMSPVLQVTDKGAARIPPVADQPVQRTVSGSVGWDVKTDEVSVVSWPMCVRLIRIYVANTALTHSIRMCLLYPDGAGNLQGGSVDSQRLDYWRTVSWDPGIVDYRVLSVCYDCLCLMALFRAVMSLVHHWPRGLYGLGPMLGIAGQLLGKNGIYHGYIHPVLWIGCVVILRRSKYLDLSLCLIGVGTLAPGGVLVRAGLRWGSSPQEGAAESRVLQGRDVRSVRVLVPDPRGVDQNFHDVTVVDMGDVPESSISIPELSTLSQQWSPAVISHIGWRQQELEGMRAAAKQRFRQSRPSSCVYCGIWIKCDMYRHMARFHLDLAQL